MNDGDRIVGGYVDRWVNKVNEKDEWWRSCREGLGEWMDE